MTLKSRVSCKPHLKLRSLGKDDINGKKKANFIFCP